MVARLGLTKVASQCKWASEYALTITCSPGYLPACAWNRFAFLRAPQRPPRQSFRLFLSIHIPRSRISQTSHPLKIQIFTSTTHTTSASFTIRFKSLPLSPFPSLSLSISLSSFFIPYVIIRRLLFNANLYIPFYTERRENQ